MSLPPSYNTPEEYFVDVLDFLRSTQGFFKFPNTHIIVNKVLTYFLPEWLPYLKNLTKDRLNNLLVGQTREDCPTSLKEFLKRIDSLKPNDTVYLEECDHIIIHNSGLSVKKLHEIKTFAPLIDKVCRECNVKFVVDVGTGVGYLPYILYTKYKFRALGLDSSLPYIKLACAYQEQVYPDSKDCIKFDNHFINEESSNKITELVKEHFHDVAYKSTCITGLHACADLSITILELFTKLDFVKCLVIMPCCYHRIKIDKSDSDKTYFKNFPVSNLLKRLFSQFDAETFITIPFLRLACQKRLGYFISMTNEEFIAEARRWMFRAILQETVESVSSDLIRDGKPKCRLKRIKRRSGKQEEFIADADKDFKRYLKSLKSTHELVYDQEGDDNKSNTTSKTKLKVDDKKFVKKMREKWFEHKGSCYLVEALTGIHASIQSICENLILLDRVVFLKERGFECYAQKVTNDHISPRCYALVALKS